MNIEVKNTGWRKHVLLHAASVYFAKKLGYFNKKRTRIKIELVPGLVKRQGYRGLANQVSKNLFQIKLDASLKPQNLIRCLAHEMIHVQQWLSGQMKDMYGQSFKVQWGKRMYRPEKLAYSKHPWEIQAHKLEKVLYKSFTMAWDSK